MTTIIKRLNNYKSAQKLIKTKKPGTNKFLQRYYMQEDHEGKDVK